MKKSIQALLCAIAVVQFCQAESTPDVPENARLPLTELRIFAEAFDRISSAYVEEIDDKTLLESAIKGILIDLDPHSSYLDHKSFSHLQENTTGNYGGLGLEVDHDDGFIKVISPMDDTPADKAGILSGDLIIQLNHQPVKGMSLSESIKIMRGEPGTTVDITIAREGETHPIELTVTREIIEVSSVRHELIEDDYGYIRIAQFQTNTGPDVVAALDEMQAEGSLNGVILDLRNNPGGVLQAAVDVADVFVDGGLIVYTEGRLPSSDMKFNAKPGDQSNDTHVVVLVNSGSASASEIVAGALQDRNRAIIMGTPTFGKGSVQTILPLNNEKAIKLTTALYYTPEGRSIQAEGIEPDIFVERSKITRLGNHPLQVTEKDLPKHLANVDEEKNKADREQTDSPSRVDGDYQLQEALTLLKGLNILAKKNQRDSG